jgi:queuosine precursor transporter
MQPTEQPWAGGRTYRYMDIISVAFVAVLIISNIVAVKALRISDFLKLDLDGGTLLFPISYIFGDVLVEVYGYARSRRVIWLGFGANVIAALTFSLVGALPAAPGWELQDEFITILGQTPRIVAASLIAFLCGSFVNAYIMSKMKIMTRGKWLWTRTIGSTIGAQVIDSLLFQVLAFGGLWPVALLLRVSLWNFIVKVTYETLATPLTYTIVGKLKHAEHEDFYDHKTNFNPFTLRM